MANKKRTTRKSTLRPDFPSMTVDELFSSEEGEDYLPYCIEQMACDYNVIPERIVIGAIHHLLFGDAQEDFFVDPHSRAYRSPTEEEEHIYSAIAYLDPGDPDLNTE